MDIKQLEQYFLDTAYIRTGGSKEELQCAKYLKEQCKKLGGKADYVTSENPTDEEIWNIQLIMPADQAGLQHVTSHNCGKCQTYCPIGSWNEKFKQRGLSKGAGAAMEVR